MSDDSRSLKVGVFMEFREQNQYVDRFRGGLFMVLLLAAALSLVAACETAEPPVEDRPVLVTGVPQGGGPVEETRAHDLANLETALERPALYVGNRVIGEATVYQIISPRSFWLESGDRRVFTVVRQDEAAQDPQPIYVRRGDTLQLSGELHTADDLSPVGDELDTLSRQIVSDEQYYLVVTRDAVEVIGGNAAARSHR